MARTLDELCTSFRMRKARFAERDNRNQELTHVMLGRFHLAFPMHFRSPVVKPMVANMLNVAAFDFADLLAPLPTISVPADKDTAAAQKRADKRGRIAHGYFDDWRMALKMLQGALWFKMYGYVPVCMWPYGRALEKYAPYAAFEDPCGYYPGPIECYGEQPLYGETRAMETADQVVMARYHGPGEVSLFLPDQGVALTRMVLPDSLKRPTLLMAMRPGVSPEELLGLLLGQARLTALVLTYAERQVHAPMALDEDSQMRYGADAVIRVPRGGVMPQKVTIQMPADVWRELDKYERELMKGSRRPASRDGTSPVSYATGKGIQQLESSIDSQLRTDQTIMSALLEDVLGTAYAMDEAMYGGREQTIGTTPETYVPAADIAGRYRAKATYGLLAGVNPSYAMVTLAQMNQAQFASRRTAMENLPTIPELSKELDRIREEQGEDAVRTFVMQAAAAGDQTALQMAMQMAPDSAWTRVVAKMQQQAQAQQQQAPAAGEAGMPLGTGGPPGAAPPGGLPGGQGPTPGAAGVEQATYAAQQGGGVGAA